MIYYDFACAFFSEYQMKLKQDYRRSLDAKRAYESRCSEEILSSQIFHKEISRHGKGSKEAEKAKTKFERMRQLLDSSEINYKLQTSEAESTRAKWEQETEDSLNAFQALEEHRVQAARNSLWKVANVISVHCLKDDFTAEDLRKALENLHVTDCLKELLDENRTGEPKPHEIWYEAMPNSSHYGLGPAPTAQDFAASHDITPNSTLKRETTSSCTTSIPPKPPRMIHYLPSWQGNRTEQPDTTSRFPFVGKHCSNVSQKKSFATFHTFTDSVDNLEYFNLSETPTNSSSGSSDSHSSSSEAVAVKYVYGGYEKKIW